MLEVNHLRFSYGKNPVLRDIHFRAVSGEMVCILGPNGTGKSTLFKCMLGLLRGWDGEIALNGEDIRQMKPGERAKKMAYIPQAANPAFAYSVLDMVTMGTTAGLHGFRVPGKKERTIAVAALEKLGIGHLLERDYTSLSGGEQQLVLIARALAQGSNTLIMDEPTSSLDYGNQVRVELQLRKLTEEGYSIIQSMHNPEQAYLFADRVVGLRDGYVIADGPPRDILNEELIEKLYRILVRKVDAEDGKGRFFEVIY